MLKSSLEKLDRKIRIVMRLVPLINGNLPKWKDKSRPETCMRGTGDVLWG